VGILSGVPIGTSLALIGSGAILHWAITAHVNGFNIQTAGTILMLVGLLGLIISLLYTFGRSESHGSRSDYDAPTQHYPPRDRY
jgi:hypothetical protein